MFIIGHIIGIPHDLIGTSGAYPDAININYMKEYRRPPTINEFTRIIYPF